jgi:hypothetical protein
MKSKPRRHVEWFGRVSTFTKMATHFQGPTEFILVTRLTAVIPIFMGFTQFSFLFKALQSPLGSHHFKSSKLQPILLPPTSITTPHLSHRRYYHHPQTLVHHLDDTVPSTQALQCLHYIIMKPFASLIVIIALVAIAVAQDWPSPASQYLNATEVEKHGCPAWGCSGTPPSAGSVVTPQSLLVACAAIFSLLASLA